MVLDADVVIVDAVGADRGGVGRRTRRRSGESHWAPRLSVCLSKALRAELCHKCLPKGQGAKRLEHARLS